MENKNSNNYNDFTSVLGTEIMELEAELREQPKVAPEPLKQPYNGGNGLQIDDINSVIGKSKLDLKTDAEKPPYCLWIGDKPVFGLGDISTTIGKAKSRKTFATGFFISALAGNTIINERIRGELPENKRTVLFIDTEQSAYYAQRSARRIFGLLGKDYYHDDLPNFQVYALRPYAPNERLQIIEHLIYNTPDLGVVFIDGVRDLITSINDEEQATMITSKLLKWSTEKMIHINCVLHMNKGDNNARGHVGTELINKSLTVLGVNKLEKNEDYSIIEPIATRDQEFNSLVFGIEEGLPYILSDNDADSLKPETGRKKAKQPTDWTNEEHAGFLAGIFENEPIQKSGDFIINVKNNYGIGRNKALDFISYFKREDLIKWSEKGNTVIYSMV
jgi:hypothetical protein